MRVKTIKDEDFVNYKKACMFIGTITCDGKCCKDANIPLSTCINNEWNHQPTITIDDHVLIERYLHNDLTSAIVFGGLEPFLQFDEVLHFIYLLRNEYNCHDDVILYTGYYKNEIIDQVKQLSYIDHIIIKFGRYKPNEKSHFDEVLGIKLASLNQYAERIC